MQFLCLLFNHITAVRTEWVLLASTMLEKLRRLKLYRSQTLLLELFQPEEKYFTLFSLFIFVWFINIQGNILGCAWLP